MAESETAGDINIPADMLWDVLRNFGDVSWIPGEPEPEWEGEGVGMVRVVRIPPLPTVREQLDVIDEEARAIHYRVIDGNPMPVTDYAASMRVVDLGEGRSRIVWSSTWQPDGVTEDEAQAAVSQLYTSVLAISAKNLESRSA